MDQVMFYNFKDVSENNLIALLFDKKPKKTTCDFLNENKIPFIWESDNEFKFRVRLVKYHYEKTHKDTQIF